MKNMFKIAALSLAVLMLAFAFAGCGKKDDGKVYKIVSDNAFKPFEYLDTATNTYVGFDMGLLAAIAADQGFKYTVENVGFDAALGQVQAGQADAVIAGMTSSRIAQRSSISRTATSRTARSWSLPQTAQSLRLTTSRVRSLPPRRARWVLNMLSPSRISMASPR